MPLPLRPLLLVTHLACCLAVHGQAQPDSAGGVVSLPTLDQVLVAKQDVWGLAAMREPNGPSYEFFARLLPPLRYVNAEFHHYPIVLSAPNAAIKARLTSNGSGLNARANLKTWKEIGVPVTFYVGEDQHVFGEDLEKLDGPHLEQGYLPIVKLRYEHQNKIFEEEAFARVESPAAKGESPFDRAFSFADNGIVYVKFSLRKGALGHVAARIDSSDQLIQANNAICISNSLAVVWFDKKWNWVPAQNKLTAQLSSGQSATLAIPTKAFQTRSQVPGAGTVTGSGTNEPVFAVHLRQDSAALRKEHDLAVATWQKLLNRAMPITVPEPLVNDAWRATLANNFTLLKNNHANYSAGNQYERLYQAECGDTARAFLLWGYGRDTLPMLSNQFDYTRAGLEFHNAGFKLQQFAHYFWLTRDTNGVEALRPKWEKEIKLIVGGREKESGLFPKERYCGDIPEHVYSLNPNAGCWRGLRDFAAVLDHLGERAEAKRLADIAAEFRVAILKAVAQSEYREAQPPFIPIMFFGKEKPYEDLTSTMVGSYWNLLAPYVIGSGVFGPPGCERERWMMDYFQEHGGICMGMVRFHQHSGLFACEDALDDLYGLRYSLKLLQLDEVDRALVSFYGKLAQGLTRETFIGAEGTGLRPLRLVGGTNYTTPNSPGDSGAAEARATLPSENGELGRPMYLPPNSTAQAYFLWMLRYLLVQDWDLDDDGTPETLRLCFATPKRWLEDGKQIKVERAPTAFGPVSLSVESKLSRGEVLARLDLPTRGVAKRTLLRIRVPDGWRVISAKGGGGELEVDGNGTVDVSSLTGKTTVRFKVKRT